MGESKPGSVEESADPSIPGSSTKHRQPKNLCRVCGTDFGSLSLFDLHRSDFTMSTKRSALIGKCREPHEMGLVWFNGAWYTPETQAKIVQQLEALAEARKK